MNKLIDNYIILERLSASEFSEVFKSRHKITNEYFAVKTISFEKISSNPKYQEQISNELKALKILDSAPNIVKFIKFLKTKNNLYIIYEYCENGTLQNYQEKSKIVSESLALFYFSQIVEGLAAIHSNKIVHGDLKPSNLLLKGNEIKIADFGFCKFLDNTANKSQYSNFFIGSPIYMAPELFEGGSETNEKTDMYALGVILYEMLFGTAPFEEKSLEDLIYKMKNNYFINFPREINEISIEIEDLLRRLLDRSPEKRYSVFELKEILNIKKSNEAIKIKEKIFDEKSIRLDDIKNLEVFKNAEQFKMRKNFEEIKKTISSEITTTFLKKLCLEKKKIITQANFMKTIIDVNIDENNTILVMNLLKKIKVEYINFILSIEKNFGKLFSDLMKIPLENFDKSFLEQMKNEDKIKEFKISLIEEEKKCEETLISFRNTLNFSLIEKFNVNSIILTEINQDGYDENTFKKSLNEYLRNLGEYANELYSSCKNEALLKEILIHGHIALEIFKETSDLSELNVENKKQELSLLSIVNLHNLFQKNVK